MITRLGSVEEVETALAQQARGESEGLKSVDSMKRVSKAMEGMRAQWASMTPKQRLDAALAEVNAELEVHGIPKIKADLAESAADQGAFANYNWEAKVSPKLAADGADPGELAATLMHEGRHAEQTFDVARLKAAEGMTAETMALPSTQGGLNIPAEIAEQAAARKLPVDSAQGLQAKEMAVSMAATMGKPYDRILARRNDAMIAQVEAKMEYAKAETQGIIDTGQPHPYTPAMHAAQRKVNEANKAFEIADEVYKGIPFERDAFEVEAEFNQHMAAAAAK